jgi:LIM domain/Protein DA1
MFGAPICKRCGQPIVGSYLTALDATWHPEHFVCAACGLPIDDAHFHVHDQAPYHKACYERELAPHCVYCGRALMGEYLIDSWGQKFCKEHENTYLHCSFCGRLVPPKDREQGAERVRCAVCRSTAIETAEDAKLLFQELKQWVGRQGLRYNNLPLSLELCSSEKLANYLKSRPQSDSLGATMSTTYARNGQIVGFEVRGVAVLLGLPAILFRGVTIHELGHVWLVANAIYDLPQRDEEGFCELLSYRYYQELNTAESRYHAQAIEHNPDHIYGDGFRNVRALTDRYGFSRLVETLQISKKMPGR